MVYETSYDAGSKPFNHDKSRGKWASPMDFLFSCIGHGFKIDAILVLPSLIFQRLGYQAVILYFIITMVCTMPIVFMQSFLGQFSSTGFISVFRIAPIFKGIGYVSLAINITTLTYYSIFAAIPFFYFLHSLRPTLPWSCEGVHHWMDYTEGIITPCNLTDIELEPEEHVLLELPSLEFFQDHLNIISRISLYYTKVTYSWPLVLCTLLIWILVWYVLKKPTEIIGRIIRYSTLGIIVSLSICVLRFSFLPGAFNGLIEFFNPPFKFPANFKAIVLLPLMALSGLGPGWGSILTMASYNNFTTDVTRYTWILCLAQFGLVLLTSFSWIFVSNFLISAYPGNIHLTRINSQWMELISLPTALSFLEMPNLWSLLFFGMLTLGATTLMIVQLFSVLTSLFDEFEGLRRYRSAVILITTCVLALVSIFFCSNHGVAFFHLMTKYSVLTQMLLNLLLLLVVLWIYGRERFQRDLHFMTNRTYPTWMVYIVRFVAPIFLMFSFLIGLIISLFEDDSGFVTFCIVTVVILLPWLLIPGYCIYKIVHTKGLIAMRFKRGVRPTDWYPADPDDRQRYEETFNNPEISHQLTMAVDDVEC